ncbi:unnamed protein product (macronuclear) [Paramecium tetraurelia]|uniref:Transmembrane protein n=1 Tax=Paramecium tetraurelia TaxID=5888 RepID=A0DF15_PARTE|nr:uncharacterized protein GSPATT00016458001 [Paramecium tetraurelia]CAK81632.1 unnamed protein product [Paramecium tetraurelia]|eukprot:XP_001449029.1 hypothetical protein (macronuclear) [Paramecium tetraurelia strain d4-2]
MKKNQLFRVQPGKLMYLYMLFLEFYRIENGKFIILLIVLALICRYLYTRKVIQRIGELIISLKILHQNQQQQQIPENDEQFKKTSIFKQLKKVMKVLKSKFRSTKDSSIDVSKKYSQFDMEESI